MRKLRAYHIKCLKIDKGTTIYIHYLQQIFEKKNGIEYQLATKYTPQ